MKKILFRFGVIVGLIALVVRLSHADNPPLSSGFSGAQVTNAAAYQAKLASNAWFNVRNAGAYGDGLHNDTTAFQNAFTNLIVYVPPGTYNVWGLTATNVTIFGDGYASVLKCTNFLVPLLSCTNNVSIRNIRFSGPDSGTAWGSLSAIATYQSNSVAILHNALNANYIKECWFNDWGSNAVIVVGMTNIYERSNACLYANNYFTNCYIGMQTKGTSYDGEYNRFIGNRASFCGYALYLGAANFLVDGNAFLDNYYNIYAQADPNGRGHGVITGNQLNHSAYPLYMVNTGTGATVCGNEIMGGGNLYFFNTIGVIVSGNVFELTTITLGQGGRNRMVNNSCYVNPSIVHNSGGADAWLLRDNFYDYAPVEALQTSQSGNYTATFSDRLIIMTADGYTVNLPQAATAQGLQYTIKQTAAYTKGTTVAAYAGDTIDGATTYQITGQNQWVTLESFNGTAAWQIVARYNYQPVTLYGSALTATASTMTSGSGYYFPPVSSATPGGAVVTGSSKTMSQYFNSGGPNGGWVSNFNFGCYSTNNVVGMGNSGTNIVVTIWTNNVASGMVLTYTSVAGVISNYLSAASSFYLTNGSTWFLAMVPNANFPGFANFSWNFKVYPQ